MDALTNWPGCDALQVVLQERGIDVSRREHGREQISKCQAIRTDMLAGKVVVIKLLSYNALSIAHALFLKILYCTSERALKPT